MSFNFKNCFQRFESEYDLNERQLLCLMYFEKVHMLYLSLKQNKEMNDTGIFEQNQQTHPQSFLPAAKAKHTNTQEELKRNCSATPYHSQQLWWFGEWKESIPFHFSEFGVLFSDEIKLETWVKEDAIDAIKSRTA